MKNLINKPLNTIKISLVLIALSMQPMLAYSAVPVIDPANLAKNIENVLQQIQQLKTLHDQLSTAKSQLETEVSTLESMVGNRQVAQLLSDPEVWKYLPGELQDWKSLVINDQSGRYGSLEGRINEIMTAMQILTPADMKNPNAYYSKSRAAANEQVAFKLASNEAIYQQTVNRVDRLDALRNAINTATDPKAIAELQARLMVEQGYLLNEIIRTMAVSNLQKAQSEAVELQSVARKLKDAKESQNRAFIIH
jgi:type IV secretion system protein VirB5